MADDEDDSTPQLAGFPYFYYDLIARVIPGAALLVLLACWPSATFDWFHQALSRLQGNGNQDGIGNTILLSILLPGLAYSIGTIYGAITSLFRILCRQLGSSYELWAFRRSVTELQQILRINPSTARPIANGWNVKEWFWPQDLVRLDADVWKSTEHAFYCLEPFAPQRFRLTVRLLAESKLASRTAISISLASSLTMLNCLFGSQEDGIGCWPSVVILVTVVILIIVSLRLRYNHVESVVETIDYLKRVQPQEHVSNWATELWEQMFGPLGGRGLQHSRNHGEAPSTRSPSQDTPAPGGSGVPKTPATRPDP